MGEGSTTVPEFRRCADNFFGIDLVYETHFSQISVTVGYKKHRVSEVLPVRVMYKNCIASLARHRDKLSTCTRQASITVNKKIA